MKTHSSKVKGKKAVVHFVENIIGELRKVVWPTRREATHLSLLVILVSITIGLFLGLLDYGFTQIVDKIFFRR